MMYVDVYIYKLNNILEFFSVLIHSFIHSLEKIFVANNGLGILLGTENTT